MEIMVRVSGVSREDAIAKAKDALKERLWNEVWKECVELEGVSLEVCEESGVFFVTAMLHQQ